MQHFFIVLFLAFLPPLLAQGPDTAGCGNMRREGKALWQEQDYERALRVYELAARRYQRAGYMAAFLDTRNEIADLLLDAGRYDSAILVLNEAIRSGERKLPLPHPSVAFSRYLLGSACLYTSQYETAKNHFRQAKAERMHLLGPMDPQVAKVDYSLGITFDYLAQFDSALFYLRQALKVQSQALGPEHLETGATCNSIGIVYSNLGIFDSTLAYYQRAMNIRLNQLGPDHPELAHNYHNMGILYYEKGDAREALKWLYKGLELRKKTYGLQHPQLFSSLYEIGFAYRDRGDLDRARDYFQQALSLVKHSMGDSHYYLSYVYGSMGNLSQQAGNLDSALFYHQMALKVNRELFGEGQDQLTQSYNNLAVVLEGKGEFAEALTYLNQSLEIRLRSRGEGHHTLAFNYLHMGNCYRGLGNQELARYWHTQAIETLQETLGEQHPDLAPAWQALAADYQATDHLDLADSLLQIAMGILVFPQSPESWQTQPGWDAVRDPLAMIRLLEQRGQLARERQQPGEALDYYEQATGLMLHLQQGYRARGSRIFMLEQGASLLEAGIAVAWDQYQQTGESHFLERAFALAGQSHANLLRAALAESEARHFSGIPDKVLQEEAALRIDLAYYENQMGADSATELRQKVFELKQAYDLLRQRLERDYPRYHQLKYNTELPPLGQMQAALVPGETLLEYFCGDSAWYLFWLQADTLGGYRIDLKAGLSDSLSAFLALLSDPSMAEGRGNDPSALKAFVDNASFLTQHLLPGLPLWEKTAPAPALVILPDGPLHYLPFEVLMQGPADVTQGFVSLPYLLHRFRFRYLHHPEGLLQAPPKGGWMQRRYAGFAPDFSSKPDAAFPPLSSNHQEVEGVQDMVGGATFLGEAATEEAFSKRAPHFQILHLATHAFVEDRYPLRSGLMFSPEPDSENFDGILHAYELYNMELPARLVVLSACQTHSGRFARGEGLMSLSRAFQYAGCPALLSSLWQADDETTASLMEVFFRYLKAGASKDEALRNAKLELLTQGRRSHPYFWASFILIGDPAPIQFWRAWPWLVGACLLLLAGLALIGRKMKLF